MAAERESYLAYVNNSGLFFKIDCLQLLKGIRSDAIDLCFTDPPFNLGKNYEDPEFTDNLEKSKYDEWCRAWLSELIRVLKPGGGLCVYSFPKIAIDLGAWLNQRTEMKYRSMIALKMKGGFPIKGRLHPAVYSILYYVKNGAKPTFNVVRHKSPICRHCKKEIRDYGGYRKKFEKFEDDKGIPWIQISDFWEDTRPARQDKSRENQVNELPLHIPERIILMASNKNDVVLDVFGGGGSTFHAAQMHGRLWIGGDIVDAAALSRFAALWGKKEAKKPSKKITQCFEEDFIKHYLSMRNKSDVRLIEGAKVLSNGSSLKRDKVISKSKVLGF